MQIPEYKKTSLFLLCCLLYFSDFGKFVDAQDENQSQISCPPIERQNLVLNLRLVVGQEGKVRILTSKLRKDKIRILGIEKTEIDSQKFTQMRIELSEFKFRKIFSGSVEYKFVERSSGPGLYCQRYVRDYIIPKRYQIYIHTMTIPDPQWE